MCSGMPGVQSHPCDVTEGVIAELDHRKLNTRPKCAADKKGNAHFSPPLPNTTLFLTEQRTTNFMALKVLKTAAVNWFCRSNFVTKPRD